MSNKMSTIRAGISLERCIAAYQQVVSEFGYTPVIKAGRTRLLDWDLDYVCGSALANFIDQVLVRRLDDFIPDNDQPRILDCGANIGFTVLNYKRQFPLAKIIAFEPDPQFAPVLRRNLERNGASDVEVVEAAVWLRDSHAEWFCEGIDGSHLVDVQSGIGTTVQTVDLARYLMDPIDLLKIDIEGAEYELVAHLAERLQNVKNIIIECHFDQSKIVPFGNMLRVLSAAGFKVSINCFGEWRDLTRQVPVPPNHWEQYLLVTGWRGEIPQARTNSSTLPYTGIHPALEWQSKLVTYEAESQSKLAASDAEWKLKEDEWQSRLAASENQLHALLKSYASTGRLGLERIELHAPFTREGEYGWVVMLPDLINSADNLEDPIRSTLLLFEDDSQLDPGHAPHEDICKLGGGRFSHWTDSLYFSTSDNADPNTNGRTYTILAASDAERELKEDERQSRLTAIEAESQSRLAAIEAGWQSKMEASENQFHALLKSYASTGRLGFERIELHAPFTREGECGWVVMLPDLVNNADNLENPIRSTLLLFEDDNQLDLSHAPHEDICKRGGGRFSHWADNLYFSTSDNSDPNTNGRTYVVLWRG